MQNVTDLEFKLAAMDVNSRTSMITREDAFFKIAPKRHVDFIKIIDPAIVGKLMICYWPEISELLKNISKERFDV